MLRKVYHALIAARRIRHVIETYVGSRSGSGQDQCRGKGADSAVLLTISNSKETLRKRKLKEIKKREFIMEKKKAAPQYSLIAGILFGIWAVRVLSWCVQYFAVLNLLYFICYAALAVLFIMKEWGICTTAVLGGLAIVELWRFFTGFESYTVRNYWSVDRFSLFVMLLYLLVALAYIGLFCIAAANYIPLGWTNISRRSTASGSFRRHWCL